jgi:hypothetical protein
LPLLDQTALALLRQVAQRGVVQGAVQGADAAGDSARADGVIADASDLNLGEAALRRAGLIRTVVVDQETPALVLTGRGVRASGALAWNLHP